MIKKTEREAFPIKEHEADLCVVGGGLAGMCAAVSAARRGIRVVLMQDRPVLGGNASSEIRMWIRGANGRDVRETGLVEEIALENCYRNPYMNFSIWDSVLYEKVMEEKKSGTASELLLPGCKNGRKPYRLCHRLAAHYPDVSPGECRNICGLLRRQHSCAADGRGLEDGTGESGGIRRGYRAGKSGCTYDGYVLPDSGQTDRTAGEIYSPEMGEPLYQ